jgi:basic membrane protein A
VIFAAAGSTGLGVLQAVRDLGILGIGVDSNQNGLHPGHILTSMLKRTDVAVHRAFQGVTPGVTALGLKEGALDVAYDEHNARLTPPAMRAAVEAARQAIVEGRLRVIDYTAKGSCR